MSTGNDGVAPPPGAMPPMPPQPPMAGPPVPEKTSLPLISLIFGILSFICIPLIGAIVAIVTGIMGRKKAKEIGQGTGMATTGLILGIISIIFSIILTIVLIAGGFAVFNAVSGQVKVAQELQPAQAASQAYGASQGSYTGLSTEELSKFGYVPSSDVNVTAVSLDGGASYCVQGSSKSDPGTVIHMPVRSSDTTITITVNDATYEYASGPCPTS